MHVVNGRSRLTLRLRNTSCLLAERRTPVDSVHVHGFSITLRTNTREICGSAEVMSVSQSLMSNPKLIMYLQAALVMCNCVHPAIWALFIVQHHRIRFLVERELKVQNIKLNMTLVNVMLAKQRSCRLYLYREQCPPVSWPPQPRCPVSRLWPWAGYLPSPFKRHRKCSQAICTRVTYRLYRSDLVKLAPLFGNLSVRWVWFTVFQLGFHPCKWWYTPSEWSCSVPALHLLYVLSGHSQRVRGLLWAAEQPRSSVWGSSAPL